MRMKKFQLYGPIYEYTSEQVDEFIETLEADEKFEIIISSPGGSVTAGLHIYNVLKKRDFKATVISHASSMASVIAMSANEIVMDEGAVMLLHNPWTITIGNSKEHESKSKSLKNMQDSLVNIYKKRTGLSAEEIQEILDEDRFWSAKELKEKGFADIITEVSEQETNDIAAMAMPSEKDLQDKYLNKYYERLNDYWQDGESKDNTTIINHKEDSSMPNIEELQSQVGTLKGKIEGKDEEITSLKAEYSELENKFGEQAKELQSKEERVQELEAELEAQKQAQAKAEVEAFLNENKNRIQPAQKEYLSNMLMSAYGDEKEYKSAKEFVSALPEHDLNKEQGTRQDDDVVAITAEEAKKVNWADLDMSIPENDAKLSEAIDAIHAKNPDRSKSDIENELLGGLK